MPPTASATETWWTVLALPSVVMALSCLPGAVSDLRTHWTDGFRPMGWIGLAKVALVLVAALIIVAVGVGAMLAPEPIRPENQAFADFAAVLLIVLDVAILGLAIAFWLERRFVVPHIHPPKRGREA